MPMTKSNDIQLQRQLYPMKNTSGKLVGVFANKIRIQELYVKSHKFDPNAKKKNTNQALVGET
jgi:hypothetical protein